MSAHQQLIEINLKYLKEHPKAESLLNGMFAFGAEELLRIYKEADGRRTYFYSSPDILDYQVY